MKICQLTGNFPPKVCGVGDYTHRLSENLTELGAEVSVITSNYNQTPRASDSVKVYPIMPDWRVSDLVTLLDCIAEIKPDVIHLQYQIATFNDNRLIYTLPFELRRRGYPLVTTFHDYAGPPMLGKLGKGLSAWLLLGSSRIVVTHDKPRTTFEKIGVLRRKLRQIPVGSNIRRRSGVEPTFSLNHDPVLSYFGFVWRGKNIENLIRLQRTLLDNELPTQLLIIGDIVEEEYHQELLSLVLELGIENRVHFTGRQNDVEISGLLQNSTICILPYSQGATTGHGTLIAAIEHELPIVSTADPTIQLSYLRNRENIMLVPIGDQALLTQAVSELLQSPLLEDTIRRNVKTLAGIFSWENIARTHLQLYDKL